MAKLNIASLNKEWGGTGKGGSKGAGKSNKNLDISGNNKSDQFTVDAPKKGKGKKNDWEKISRMAAEKPC